MDYRVIGHETFELDFVNQKVPGPENSGSWLFLIKNVPVSEKKCHFYQPEMSFSDRNSVFRSHCGHFEEKYCDTDRVLTVSCQNDIFVFYNLCFE